MKYIALLCTAAAVISLSSCTNTTLSKSQQGAVGGAAGGALIGQAIGRSTEATLIGAFVGTTLGYIVGNEMEKYDRQRLNDAYERGPSGQQYSWVNPDTNNQYQVTPQPAYTAADNTICRKAEMTSVIDGQPQTINTTACRNAQGQWVLQ
ncbi:MAG: glycine zipper 2TM domain-containing protein [Desulfofustis sp. PB-SRB1]|jgi:surface antigen|nr:glycine zipper 2TM domain-containing protein [Desulfofustis sp. PB-SRB1]MBM1003588.1 glycine zipper 2TM domain-containing protein [Desulfofustis sp. PB-SRB1]HBH28875.1 glycine zipper 2TM domain-containing protein [Desulfofustis sp.]HBH30872.1 glycine zipper 2TM domain-containing protein [Desulfofustis sp.]